MNAKANTQTGRQEPAPDAVPARHGAPIGTSMSIPAGVMTTALSLGRLAQPAARTLFWAILVLLAVQAASALALADPAMAQGVDGGSVDNIEQSGTKFYDWLQSIMRLLAGIGFLLAAAWWALAGSNDRRKQQGTSGMVCAIGAFFAAALVPDFLAAVADWTGAQG